MSPPTTEKSGLKAYRPGNNIITRLADRLAADDIPIMPGSVRGFCITACRRTPDVARAAPASIDIIILGNLRSYIVATSGSYSMNKPLNNFPKVISMDPVFAE